MLSVFLLSIFKIIIFSVCTFEIAVHSNFLYFPILCQPEQCALLLIIIRALKNRQCNLILRKLPTSRLEY